MRKIIWCCLLSVLFFISCSKSTTDSQNRSTTVDKPGWQLVWSDEFEDDGLPKPSKWGYDVGGHGWGNQELQYYTQNRLENARVADGKLIIEARRESWEGSEYTSARLVTKNKGDWTYGLFEIRAKLPSGRGTWPAIWMLPTTSTYGGWPNSGEIDIMEHVGFDPGWVHGSVHTKSYYWQIGTQKTERIRVADAQTAFHVYTLEWSPEKIQVGVDTTRYFAFSNEGTGWEVWPFNNDFHLVLNIAVGGAWGGQQGVDPSIFPQRLEVDYVRVYRKID